MAISNEQKEEIKARTDIVDLVASYGYEIEYKGGRPWVKCPFHGEKTASCQLHPEEGFFHCFGCGKSGDVVNFVMEMEGVPFVEALKRLADKAGVEIKETENPIVAKCRRLKALTSEIATDFHTMLKVAPDALAAREYLSTRELDGKTSDAFLIGYVPDDVDKILSWAKRKGYTEEELCAAGIIKASDHSDGKPYSYFGGRLLFTIRNKHGEVVAFSGRLLEDGKKGVGKYINSPETIIFKKSRTFFAFDKARSAIVKSPNREAIICEGQIDCIRLHINGFSTAIAPLGTSFTEDHASQLKKVADSALLVFDDDAAGHKATIRTAGLLLAEDMAITVVSLPDGDDPDSYIRRNGAEAFRKLIESKSESIVRFQIRAERQKEEQPDSANAIVRISKAVMETISHCKSAVMKTALIKEAASILGIGQNEMMAELEQTEKSSAKSNTAEPRAEETKDTEDTHHHTHLGLHEPTKAEICLVAYLMDDFAPKKKEETLKYLKVCFPSFVFNSTMTKKIVEAVTKKPEHQDDDYVRNAVESLSDEEYGYFTEAVIEKSAMTFIDIPDNLKVIYLARQIWHDYLVRQIGMIQLSWVSDAEKKEKTGELARNMRDLLTMSPKQTVKFFRHFNHKTYSIAPKQQQPNSQEGLKTEQK